jgi:hypothetical protein
VIGNQGNPQLQQETHLRSTTCVIKTGHETGARGAALLWISNLGAPGMVYNPIALEELVHNERNPLATRLLATGCRTA